MQIYSPAGLASWLGRRRSSGHSDRIQALALAAGMGVAVLSSCSTPSANWPGHSAEVPFVWSVDFSTAPHTEALAERARQTGNEMYPKVCALLGEEKTDFPRQFDICLKPTLASGNAGETRSTRICLNATHLGRFQGDLAAFDQTLVHEMAHVAQDYEEPALAGWLTSHRSPPSRWIEGIADYVCFKLGETNGWRCPQCGVAYPHYRNGYSCAGAFLLFLDATYNSNIVRQLNTVLRRRAYTDAFFATATGKELPELWAQFQQTTAFTPGAARMLELQQQLGYVNGEPPKDIKQRFDAFVDQHADGLTKHLLQPECTPGLATGDLSTRMATFLYFAQPGGAAETYLLKLQNEKLLPGLLEAPQAQLTGLLGPRDLDSTFPATRTFIATNQNDACAYHYTVVRGSQQSGWKLQRAWRASADGTVTEEYPLQ